MGAWSNVRQPSGLHRNPNCIESKLSKRARHSPPSNFLAAPRENGKSFGLPLIVSILTSDLLPSSTDLRNFSVTYCTVNYPHSTLSRIIRFSLQIREHPSEHSRRLFISEGDRHCETEMPKGGEKRWIRLMRRRGSGCIHAALHASPSMYTYVCTSNRVQRDKVGAVF